MEQLKVKELKLNLGCGHKLYDGWVNVDAVKPKGELPANVMFVEDDFRALNHFQENTVSEMVGLHIVEHVPVYDLEPMLIRWHEVLKPGGVVVVEMPCIIKSCVNLLQMLATKDSNIYYNLGLKGIFGEPDPTNPYMEHKWGWTFETLAQQFRNAGFVNIQEQIPQTHMKTVRDFRLYAEKAKNEEQASTTASNQQAGK